MDYYKYKFTFYNYIIYIKYLIMQKNIKVGGSFEIEHKILKYQSKLDDSYRAGNIEKLIFYSNKIKLYKTLKKMSINRVEQGYRQYYLV